MTTKRTERGNYILKRNLFMFMYFKPVTFASHESYPAYPHQCQLTPTSCSIRQWIGYLKVLEHVCQGDYLLKRGIQALSFSACTSSISKLNRTGKTGYIKPRGLGSLHKVTAFSKFEIARRLITLSLLSLCSSPSTYETLILFRCWRRGFRLCSSCRPRLHHWRGAGRLDCCQQTSS